MTQTSPSRRSSPDSPPGRPRDGLLDLLRSLSITRVIGIHLIGRSGFWFWPAPTYVLPGMPMVFFVSGALVPKEGCLWHLPFREGIADDQSVEFLPKPYSLDQINSKVKEVLGKRSDG